MFLFKRKKETPPTPSVELQRPQPKVLDGIRYSTDTARKYSVTPEETAFFEAFDAALRAAGKSTYYKTTRMADGVLSVSSSRAYLGKIKLQGKKTRMQYEKRGGNFTALEGGTLEQYIDLLSYWVRTA